MFSNKIRNIHGIFLLDKPTGISSNKALQIIKKILLSVKAGHTGSLDPLATGLLPICIGEATKFSKYLLKSSKKYRVIAKLGIQTSTLDSYGKITKISKVCFNELEYQSALKSFLGKIIQKPPFYSAIKYKGVPLYKYARKGIFVPIKSRFVKIYSLKSLYKKDNIIELEITCSSGTYIRSIINDLGELLKCGAHVIFLRRSKVSFYSISSSITIDQLKFLKKKYFKKSIDCFLKKFSKFLIPIHSLVSNFPKFYISKKEFNFIKNGQSVKIFTKLSPGIIRIINNKKIFLGLGLLNKKNVLSPYRLLNYAL